MGAAHLSLEIDRIRVANGMAERPLDIAEIADWRPSDKAIH